MGVGNIFVKKYFMEVDFYIIKGLEFILFVKIKEYFKVKFLRWFSVGCIFRSLVRVE